MAELFVRTNCTYCQEEISGLRVKCCECPEIQLCLQCFSAGAEIGPHKNDHSYQFCNSDAVGVTFGRGGWSAREELNLLDAVEVYGFGNWEDISKHIETRTSEEAKEQYISRYLDGTIGRLTWPLALTQRPNLSQSLPSSPAHQRLPPLDLSPEDAKELNYMPFREDFDHEFENDAELLLSELCVNETEEDDLDIALTLVQVDVYAQTLRERIRRKRVARDYQLAPQFFNGTKKLLNKKKLTKEEKEFQEGMKVFCQFHTSSEHEQFLQNMQREQELKVRLSELQRYRRHGITRHEECVHLEQLLHNQQFAQSPNSAGSSGASPSHQTAVQLFQPAQLSTYLRKRGKGDETAWCSTERKCILGNLGVAGCEGSSTGGLGDATPLLSKQEVALCATLGLTPAEYLALKTAVIKDGKLEMGAAGGIENTVNSFLTQQSWL